MFTTEYEYTSNNIRNFRYQLKCNYLKKQKKLFILLFYYDFGMIIQF